MLTLLNFKVSIVHIRIPDYKTAEYRLRTEFTYKLIKHDEFFTIGD